MKQINRELICITLLIFLAASVATIFVLINGGINFPAEITPTPTGAI